MKHFLVLSLLGSISIGCDSDPIKESYIGNPDVIALIAQKLILQGNSEDTLRDTLTAVCRDNNGAALAGAKVDFFIREPEPWKGLIHRVGEDSVSRTNGEVRAVYEVILTKSGPVVIEARFGIHIARLTLQLEMSQ